MEVWRGTDLGSRDEFFDILATTNKSQFATMALKPGQASGEFGTDHPQADQYLLVLEGEGEVRGGDWVQPIAVGDVVLIPAGEKHQFKCTGSSLLRSITFYGPAPYPEES